MMARMSQKTKKKSTVRHTRAIQRDRGKRPLAALLVSQQAVAQRFGSLPAELFWRVLVAVLPVFHARWQDRQRPLPPELAWA